jgi:hypothetical protein
MGLGSVPEWLATALLAASLATLGFVGKQILEWVGAVRGARRTRRARLVTLLSLLNGSAAVFRVQAVLRDRLFKAVTERKPELSKIQSGYEAVFSTAFPSMTNEERQLHALIRGYTTSGLKPLNEAIIQWLQADTEFKLACSRRRIHVDLAQQLAALESHLLMWLAKYAAWIPETPAHALVYLADEEDHGVPFPHGIERTIGEALDVAKASGG